jgi:hypothetical protein
LYYGKYEKALPFKSEVKRQLERYFSWVAQALPSLSKSRYRHPTDFYALIGALERYGQRGRGIQGLSAEAAGLALAKFEGLTKKEEPVGLAARYVAAASRQTDNIAPRTTRIESLLEVLREA